jgi:hypothetical protein
MHVTGGLLVTIEFLAASALPSAFAPATAAPIVIKAPKKEAESLFCVRAAFCIFMPC